MWVDTIDTIILAEDEVGSGAMQSAECCRDTACRLRIFRFFMREK